MTNALPSKLAKVFVAAAIAVAVPAFGAVSAVPAPDEPVAVAAKPAKTDSGGRKVG